MGGLIAGMATVSACPDERMVAARKRMPGHPADSTLMPSSARLRQQIIR